MSQLALEVCDDLAPSIPATYRSLNRILPAATEFPIQTIDR
jgi:hypothetical protein